MRVMDREPNLPLLAIRRPNVVLLAGASEQSQQHGRSQRQIAE